MRIPALEMLKPDFRNKNEIFKFSLFIVSEKYYLCTRFAQVVIPIAIGMADTPV